MVDIALAPTRDEELRRFPRIVSRCHVEIRDRYGVWTAETEDVGPRGCRIVTPRAQTVGTLLRLTISSELVAAVLEVAGQVVWARRDRTPRAGISFTGTNGSPRATGPSAWFDSLLAAEGLCAEIEIAVGAPELAEPLPPRLLERARQLFADGHTAAAAVIARRALDLAPDDPLAGALVREIAGRLVLAKK